MPSNLPPSIPSVPPAPAPVEVDPASLPPSKRPHDVDSSELLMNIYLEKRLDGQKQFYLSRVKEFQSNSNFMVRIGAILLFASAVLSGLGAYFSNPYIAFMTAILPTFASLVASMRQLYQWDKQASLYRDAVIGLDEAKLSLPDLDIFDRRTANVVLPTLVKATEEVFISEINQWGQIALGLKDQEGQDALNARLQELKEEDRASLRGGRNPILTGVGGGTGTGTRPPVSTPPISPRGGSGFPPPPPQEDDGVG